MNNFQLSTQTCIGCGLCVRDCLPNVLRMIDGKPQCVEPQSCMRCLHCLTVCPTGSISVLGHTPQESKAIDKALPDFASLRLLAKARRSVRHYKPCSVAKETIQEVLDAAHHAPTGTNARKLWVGVIDTKTAMDAFRSDVYARIATLAAEGRVPESRRSAFFIHAAQQWKENGEDAIFRGAPHCIFVGNDKTASCYEQDPVIYLSYFELLAQAHGLGTCWCGLAYWALTLVVPEFIPRLGLPETHGLSYAMLFGLPAVHYARTLELGAAQITNISW